MNTKKVFAKPKCPTCGATQVYHRKRTGTFRCWKCGHEWEQEVTK